MTTKTRRSLIKYLKPALKKEKEVVIPMNVKVDRGDWFYFWADDINVKKSRRKLIFTRAA